MDNIKQITHTLKTLLPNNLNQFLYINANVLRNSMWDKNGRDIPMSIKQISFTNNNICFYVNQSNKSITVKQFLNKLKSMSEFPLTPELSERRLYFEIWYESNKRYGSEFEEYMANCLSIYEDVNSKKIILDFEVSRIIDD